VAPRTVGCAKGPFNQCEQGERVSEFEFDPFDPRFFRDPWPYYQVMRDEHPVYRREIENFRVWPHYWMLSRADDVDRALSDWQTFSSARGTLVDTDITLIPPNMFNMDPPRHDELRGILSRNLTPSRITALEPHVRAYANELVDGFAASGAFDAQRDFGHLIPTITMCVLMDLPAADREQFLKWNLDTLGGADFTSEAALAAYGEMAVYWEGIVAARRGGDGTDLISQIVNTQLPGEDLSDAEVGGFCSLLHDAAQNTTMNMITHGVVTLAHEPDARRRLAGEPGLWPKAVEELLRYVSPVQGLARTTTRPVELHGVTIPEGDQVLVLYGSANHDERVHVDPERFDLDRESTKAHWAFGHGIHYCLGNAVARLEIQTSLQVLVERIGDWDVDDERVELNQLVPTRGVASAPVSFAPESG
jgi:cytochrome P450